jgi:hypothetical protein
MKMSMQAEDRHTMGGLPLLGIDKMTSKRPVEVDMNRRKTVFVSLVV